MTHPNEQDLPEEIDFTSAQRGFHHIPHEGLAYLPTHIERSVWEYYAEKAQRKGLSLSELLSDILKRDMEIHEALK